MYETYARYIYEWLVNTFYPAHSEQISGIMTALNAILQILQYGLYLGVFALILWVFWSIVRPHFFKC